jgi:hypothetical protein
MASLGECLWKAAEYTRREPDPGSDYLDLFLPSGFQLARVGKDPKRWVLLRNQRPETRASGPTAFAALSALAARC